MTYSLKFAKYFPCNEQFQSGLLLIILAMFHICISLSLWRLSLILSLFVCLYTSVCVCACVCVCVFARNCVQGVSDSPVEEGVEISHSFTLHSQITQIVLHLNHPQHSKTVSVLLQNIMFANHSN